MADKKSDLRVVRTRNALRAAFEELIAETTLDKITVKALTGPASTAKPSTCTTRPSRPSTTKL